MSYQHTQPATLILSMLAAAVVFEAGLIFFIDDTAARTIIGIVLLFLLLLMYCFRSLSVKVEQGQVEHYFGPGFMRRRYDVDSIRRAEAVRNPWYYGWGVRLTPRGWLFNVSGLDAVEVEFSDDRRIRIGTDEPAELSQAIQNAIPGKGTD